MRRLPNPWFLIPSLLAGLLGALLGREIARVTCTFGSESTGCPGFETTAAILGGITAFLGVAVVVNLALRSLAEWRENVDAREEAEAGDDGR